MKVIGIHGKAQHGKGTFISSVFDTYKEHYPNARFIEDNFADPLKEAVHIVFRIPKEDMYTTKGKAQFLPQFNTTIRDILQRFGTEGCRSIFEDIWVWNLSERLKVYESEGYDLVGISDLRFKNEYKFLRDSGAFTVKVVRLGYENIDESTHQSEVDLDDIDDWDLICKAESGSVYKVSEIAQEFTQTKILKEITDEKLGSRVESSRTGRPIIFHSDRI